MNDSVIEIGGHAYSVGQMSTFDQMQLAADFRDGLSGLAALKDGRPEGVTDAQFKKTASYIMTGGLSLVAPDRRQRILSACLSKVKRRIGEDKGWASVLNAAGGLQYKDVDLGVMFELAYVVFDQNGLLDFFSDGPLGSGGPTIDESGLDSQAEKIG